MGRNPWTDMTLEEAREYDERKDSGPGRHAVAVKRRFLWNLIWEYLPADRSVPVLDLGGGTGVWAIPLARQGYDVVLVDISPGFLARAEEKLSALGLSHKVTLMEGQLDDLRSIPDGEFPLVLALGDPVSYCADAALKEIRRVTCPAGTVVADVENRYGGVNGRRAQDWDDVSRILLDGVAFWPGSDHRSPIRLFGPDDLHEALLAAGWHIEGIWPADLLVTLIGGDFLRQIVEADGGVFEQDRIREWVDLEARLRDNIHLLGCGSEIQFAARNPG